METTPTSIDPALAKKIARAYAAADASAYFGPTFFMSQLGALARASCPTAEERVGVVEVHLLGGEVLEVCHIVSLAPKWVALAVFDERVDGGNRQRMRTELVAYPCIARVTLSSASRSNGRIGFGQDGPPQLSVEPAVPAEELLARAAGASAGTRASLASSEAQRAS